MDKQEILQHLLDMEAQAADLVDDAQKKSDKRISEGEHQNITCYEEVYAREVQALEGAYAENLVAAKDDYRKQLEEYRESLKAMPLNVAAFSALAEKLILAAVPRCKGQ